jgi:hypothetical protein
MSVYTTIKSGERVWVLENSEVLTFFLLQNTYERDGGLGISPFVYRWLKDVLLEIGFKRAPTSRLIFHLGDLEGVCVEAEFTDKGVFLRNKTRVIELTRLEGLFSLIRLLWTEYDM